LCEASLWDVHADTIVPAGVQGLDRYAYVNNNPVRYTDPSGHMAWENPSGGRIEQKPTPGLGSTTDITAFISKYIEKHPRLEYVISTVLPYRIW